MGQILQELKVRACLKNHSRNLHAPLCGIFYPNSVAVARYGALIRTKSPTNCDAHLAESFFQTRSRQWASNGQSCGDRLQMSALRKEERKWERSLNMNGKNRCFRNT